MRRSVRSSNQVDREGDAGSDGQLNGDAEDMPARGRGRSRFNRRGRGYYNQPPFSVFLGNVPPHSRLVSFLVSCVECIHLRRPTLSIQYSSMLQYII